MFDLISVGAQPKTMTSHEIAALTGKEVGHVHRDIRAMVAALGDDPDLDHLYEEKDARGYTALFRLNKSLSLTLVAGYSAKLRKAIVDRWQELEGAAPKPVELSRMDILRLAMDAEEARIKAESERDEAIRTKAMIGSKREATAMATAAKAVREVARLKQELGTNEHHATVLAVEKATGKNYSWRPLRQWCADHKVEPATVPDKRYGEVKAWPADAWGECHAVDLHELFSEGKLK